MRYRTICENHLFSKVYAGGKKAQCRTLSAYCLTDKKAAFLRRQNPEKKKYNRIGLTVSKKIGIAVKRTRARRLLREAYRLIEKDCLPEKDKRPRFEMEQGKLLVFVAKPCITDCRMQEVKADLEKALLLLGVLRPFGTAPKPGGVQKKDGTNGMHGKER